MLNRICCSCRAESVLQVLQHNVVNKNQREALGGKLNIFISFKSNSFLINDLKLCKTEKLHFIFSIIINTIYQKSHQIAKCILPERSKRFTECSSKFWDGVDIVQGSFDLGHWNHQHWERGASSH